MMDEIPQTCLKLSIADGPITEPVTKFGGQPVWLDEPQWPIAEVDGAPMTFIAQFRLPGDDVRLAYLFMSDDDSGVTWETNGGDNALIVHGPGARLPDFLTIEPATSGPSIGPDVTATPDPDAAADNAPAWIGGKPAWIQADETPGDDWRFLFQMSDSGPGFRVNFGDLGFGYGFVSADLCEGRFLWQCH